MSVYYLKIKHGRHIALYAWRRLDLLITWISVNPEPSTKTRDPWHAWSCGFQLIHSQRKRWHCFSLVLLSANALKDHRSTFTFEDTFTLKPGGLGVRTCYFVFSSHLMSRPYLPSVQRWCTHICGSTFLAQGKNALDAEKNNKKRWSHQFKETWNILEKKIVQKYVFAVLVNSMLVTLFYYYYSFSLWRCNRAHISKMAQFEKL